jgi:hypothetical protein
VTPTYEVPERFWREFGRLDALNQRAFLTARTRFVAGLGQDPPAFEAALRVKRVKGHAGVWEMTFAADGRATFEYGTPRGGGAHIVWRRIGTHAILSEP